MAKQVDQFIREELLARAWSHDILARLTGLPIEDVVAIAQGEQNVTPETAAALGAAFGTTPEYWLNLARGQHAVQIPV